MKIKSIIIKEGYFSKRIEFDKKNSLIFSYKNSRGKTTLLRLLLYAMGYAIPSTKNLDFTKLETTIELVNENTSYKMVRSNESIELYYENICERYVLPYELNQMLGKIYGVQNESILNNLLGSFYFDQEKGWTLLNRGKVIGKNSFNIEELVRGLSDRDCSSLILELQEIKVQIEKHKQMLDLSEYQKQLRQDMPNAVISHYDTLEDELSKLMNILHGIDKELFELDKIIRENKAFIEFIEEANIAVQHKKLKEPIPVNRDTIFSFNENQEFILARKTMLLAEKAEVTKIISRTKSELAKEEQLVSTKSLIAQFDERVLLIDIDQKIVKNIINKLQKKKSEISQKIKEKTKLGNIAIDKIYQYVRKYASILELNEIITERNDYIFTKDLKGLSGAILHKLVFIFKMAYLKTIEEYTSLKLPILIDSPNGREVDKMNIDTMFTILQNDFDEYQIIIASIYNNYNVQFNTIFEIKEYLMENANGMLD